MNMLIALAIIFPTFASTQSQVAADAASIKPIPKGVLAPNPKIQSLDGKDTELKSVLAGKPTVVIFYRGGWCPFCNRQMAELGQTYPELIKMGYQLVALSMDTPAKLKEAREKGKVQYTLYSDAKAEAAKAFGVAFRVDDGTFTIY